MDIIRLMIILLLMARTLDEYNRIEYDDIECPIWASVNASQHNSPGITNLADTRTGDMGSENPETLATRNTSLPPGVNAGIDIGVNHDNPLGYQPENNNVANNQHEQPESLPENTRIRKDTVHTVVGNGHTTPHVSNNPPKTQFKVETPPEKNTPKKKEIEDRYLFTIPFLKPVSHYLGVELKCLVYFLRLAKVFLPKIAFFKLKYERAVLITSMFNAISLKSDGRVVLSSPIDIIILILVIVYYHYDAVKEVYDEIAQNDKKHDDSESIATTLSQKVKNAKKMLDDLQKRLSGRKMNGNGS